ncbi:MAG: histidine phosphatase family protein [Chloroflexota bacterium]
MNRLLLVRHAEATSACRDAELTAIGRKQAEAVARRLRGWSFDAAWSSDLRRANETAEVIMQGRDALPLQLTAALREVEVPTEIGNAGPQSEQYARWEKETIEALARSLSMWLSVVDRSQGERHSTTLVVSHGGPLRVLLCLLLGLPPEMHWSFRLDHAGITIVERGDDMGTITLLNDRCHLG